MSREVYTASVLRERWDDAARLYTAWNASGVQTSQRPYTAAENTQADVEATAATSATNERTLRDGLLLSIAALKADIDTNNATIAQTNATINANPAAEIKALARIQKDQSRALLRLLKIVAAQFADADTGSA